MNLKEEHPYFVLAVALVVAVAESMLTNSFVSVR
jgi:hypothetical protein